MCSICMQTLCHPRCPNAPEPVPVYVCRGCGCGIYPGDEYLELGGVEYCKECLEDMAVETLLDLVGESLSTAEERSCSYGG